MLQSEFERQLKIAKRIEELGSILRTRLADFTITTFSFTYYAYHPKSRQKLKYDYATDNFRAWHEHFVAENYDEIDSTMGDVYQEVLPVFWDVKEQLKNAQSKRERQMRLDSIDFGADKGLCIPVHGPHGDFANLMVEQMQGECSMENWQQHKYEFMAIAYCFYHYVRKSLLKSGAVEANPALSVRQQQCLELLAQNYSVEQIAKALHITERTVNYHFQEINKQFGLKNKHQSLAHALEMGLLVL
ncbi:MAG: autoinducer binding domain-containing protein [Gammaproteobacteria bacterium]|nr:autoinducer binding domain-containing protein [Gammaproteobacteria bacterium]